MSVSVQNIPKSLIYEMVDGVPIYYKGYKDYLNGIKNLDEIMGSSLLQSALAGLIVARLNMLLTQHYGQKYLVLTNELGILFKKKSWRSGFIRIYKLLCLLKKINPGRFRTGQHLLM